MRLQVIGDPVLHSKSPLLHAAMLAELGLDVPYAPRVVRRGELPQYLAWARENGITGFNATMPHKEDLLPLLDEIDPAARAVGAVNTVCLRDGRWVGFNTDGGGAVYALRDGLGLEAAGLTAVLLGAGGAARAVALALSAAGAERVFVCNRTPERARALCAQDPLGRLSPAAFDPATLSDLAGRSQLLVNCTNLGMEGCGHFQDFSFLGALPPDAGVFDLIYHPAETELLSQAKRRGLRTLNGLPMLVGQAVLALEHFLDRPLDRKAMAAAAADALRREGT
ncbi:MAG: shikimate dehydrogenase [Oscillospiraceae bacterium]|jgi:shikimate dehydrogenase|nr:shikimate dehydrogenase [Oscillospiraceae bacterium]